MSKKTTNKNQIKDKKDLKKLKGGTYSPKPATSVA